MLAVLVLSQAGSSVASAYDLLVAMSILTVAIPYVFMFSAYAKCSNMAPVAGAWVPPGGRRTSLVLAWLGLISTVIAIGCTQAPNNGDPHPMLGLIKIVVSSLVVLAVGLIFYRLADRKRKTAANISFSPKSGGAVEKAGHV